MTIKVDLLDRPGRRMGFDPIIFFLVFIVIASIIGFYVYGQSLEKKIKEKKSEIAEVNEKIRSLEDKIPRITELEKINQDLETQINVIKQLVYDPIRYANLLDEIALIIPKSIFIRNLRIDPQRKTLSFSGLSVQVGGALPLDSISKFMTNIQKSRIFKRATLSNTSRTRFMEKTAYNFQITTEYDPEKAVQQ